MDRPSRLPVDCPRCENCGVLALDDDRTIACPLCNNWCTLCLEGVPTFVQITRPYRGSLIAGVRPSADGEILFEGYACDYHKATLKSYSSIAPAMVGRYASGQAYLAAQGRVFVVCYGYGEARNWQELEDAAQQAIWYLSIRARWVGVLSLSSRACCAGRTLMMRRSPSLSGPTRHYESSGQPPSGTMAAFDAWLECAAPARCFAGRFAADESASGGSRMRESQVSARSGSGGWRGPFHTTRDAAHLSF